MRALVPTLVCLLLSCAVKAQPQHAFWPFGSNAGLDFTGGAPSPVATPMSTDEGCTSISDGNGNLLFYTNGETVWDRDHEVMDNGTGLNGSFSSSQSALVVPFPDDPDRYYIFTSPAEAGMWGGQPNAAYSVVDLSQNNGAGVVVNKNTLLEGPVTEKLTAARHANGRDVWVLYHRWQSDEYLAYLVTCQGLEGPVVTAIGKPMISNPDGSGSSIIGCMRLNRQGTRLATAWGQTVPITSSEWIGTAYFDVLDFDNGTGQLSSIMSDSAGGTPELFLRNYGVEFSPNGSVVYLSDHGLLNGGAYSTILQYDLTSPDPMNNEFLVANGFQAFGSLQLGPDDRIYSARLNGATYLSAITDPDVVGTGCGFVDNAVSTGTDPSTWGLPNHWDTYPDPPLEDPVALRDTIVCSAAEGILLDATWSHPFHTPNYLWSTGGTTASISVNTTGTYVVEIQLPCSTITDTVGITVGGVRVDLGGDRSICEDGSLLLDAGIGASTVLWSTGDTTHSIAVHEEGTYTVSVTDAEGCTNTDAVFVEPRNCECPLYIPNTFTPNGDGVNDVLRAAMDCSPTAFEFIVYDRWGHSLHNTTDPDIEWTGDGHPIGVYTFTLHYAWMGGQGLRSEDRSGSVTLIR